MQGTSDPNLQLLDAAALCRQLVDPHSVAALLADHRHELFPDELLQALEGLWMALEDALASQIGPLRRAWFLARRRSGWA